jgi:hypothetical protein
MPRDKDGHEIAPMWTVIRIERHGLKEITIGYAYLCPGCQITFTSKQVSLFAQG